MIALSLPYPPSTNRLWRAVNGRNIKSAEYRKWEARCLGDLLEQRVAAMGQMPGPYWLTLYADRPDLRRRDLGNIEKPVSDALVTAGVVKDDCLAQSITLRWSDRKPGSGARVHITLEAA